MVTHSGYQKLKPMLDFGKKAKAMEEDAQTR
jgi:hypothetical protein